MNYLVYAIPRYEYLKKEFLSDAAFTAGGLECRRFPDGEGYLRILDAVTGKHVVLIGGTVDAEATLELYDLGNGLVRAGAASLCIVVPYFGYSTQERPVQRGEVVIAKSRALLLSSIPQSQLGNRVVLVDLHSIGTTYYFEGHTRPFHFSAKPFVLEVIHQIGEPDVVIACTDAGRAKWVESLANAAGLTAAFVFKKRLDGGRTEITGVNADVKGRHVVIFDDMIRTGSSILQAAKAYKKFGAKKITAVATHGILPGDSLDKLLASGLFAAVHTSNSHPRAVELKQKNSAPTYQVHPLGGLLASFVAGLQ